MRQRLTLVTFVAIILAASASARGEEAAAAPAGAEPQRSLLADRPVRFWPLVEDEVKADGTRDTSVLWPIYRRVDGPAAKALRVFPFWFASESATDRDRVAFPLVWSFVDKAEDRSTLVVAPLLFRRRQGDATAGTVFPLYWWRRSPRETSHVVFPLVWHASDAQLETSSTLVLPLYYHARRLEGSTRVLWPLLGTSDDACETRGQALSWLVRWTASKTEPATGAVGVGVPHLLGLYGRETGPGSSAFRVLSIGPEPLGASIVGGHSRADEDELHAFPVLFWKRGVDGGHLVVAPIFGRGESSSERWGMALPPLIRWERSKTTAGDGKDAAGIPGVLDICGDSREGERREVHGPTLFPGLGGGLALARFARHGPETTASHVFPVFWQRRSPEGGYLHVFPLYGQSREGTRETHWALTPLLRIMSDPGAHETEIDAPFPLVAWRSSEAEHHFRALPLVWWTKRASGEELGTVFPLAWLRKDATSVDRLLLPLYIDHEDLGAQKRTQVFLGPTYIRTRAPDLERDDVLFPLISRTREPGHDHERALPLYWHERDDRIGRETRIVFPIYWHGREGEREFTHILPFYGEHRDGERSVRRFFFGPVLMTSRFQEERGERARTDVLWPLGSYERAPGETHVRALPLFWHSENEKREEATTVAFPLVWRFRDRDRRTLIVFPFFAGEEEGASTTRSVLGPLYVYHREGAADAPTITHAPLWPLCAYTRGPDRTHVRALPLFWHESDRAAGTSRTVGFPLFWHARGPERATDVVFPFYASFERGERRTQLFGGPLYVRTRDGDARTDAVLWPLFVSSRHGDAVHAHAFPLYWYRSRGEGEDRSSSRVVFPLYWHFRQGLDAEQVHVFPLYRYAREGAYTRHTALYPLFYRGQGPGRSDAGFLWPLGKYASDGVESRYRFAPLVFGKSTPGEAYTLAPLLLYRHDARGQAVDDWQWRRLLAPVSVLSGGGERHVAVFGALVNVNTSAAKDYDVRILHKLVQVSNVKGERTRRFSPLFRYESSEAKKSVDFSLLGPVFRYVREGDRKEVRIFHFIRI